MNAQRQATTVLSIELPVTGNGEDVHGQSGAVPTFDDGGEEGRRARRAPRCHCYQRLVRWPSERSGREKVVKVAKLKRTKRSAPIAASDQIFTIHTDGDATSELKFHVDDEYRVIERNKDAVLIEVLGNADNPYFVSSEILASLSDFPADKAAEGD